MSQVPPTVRTPGSAGEARARPTTPGPKPLGLVLCRGRSLRNGQRIVCIATGLARRSKNRPTGPVVQTYILPDGTESPLAALASGGDAAVCGDCPHRPVLRPDGRRTLGSCYVNV